MLSHSLRWLAPVMAGLLVMFSPALVLGHHVGHHHNYCAQSATEGCPGWDHCPHNAQYCTQTATRANAPCDYCYQAVDPTKATTVHGKVESVSLTPGEGFPSISIVTDQGEKLSILVAPFWYLKGQQFEVKQGDNLTVSIAKAKLTQGERNVAIELKQANGKTLRLRDEGGLPLWMRGRGQRCCPGA